MLAIRLPLKSSPYEFSQANLKMMMTAYSILDLVRVAQGRTPKDALDEARNLANVAERHGYTRYWMAEHHNMVGIASAATALAIAHVAAGTSHIRVGAGGIMLPNHAPLIIAEQFGTLAHLYPDRIDLGLGRAPGTDGHTMRAMRRDPMASDSFPQDVVELKHYFSDAVGPVQAVPATGTQVPLWLLGSSTFGARLAAELGLPYAFASHFAPDQLMRALEIYRIHFKPSDQLSEPYIMVAANVITADTDTAAKRLATTQQQSFANLIRGRRGLSQPPIDDINHYWSPAERMQAERMLACSVYGAPDTVKDWLSAFQQQTGAHEIIMVTDIYDPVARAESVIATASVMQSLAA